MVGATAERGEIEQQSGGFVNLYDVLQVPANADGEIIRKQINKMYLEAQQNLDHRNAKKRLRYQQLFQVHLPQARFYLLDNERRQQYDRALTLPPTQAVDEAPSPDTEVNLAIREELWRQWQDSLVEESDSSVNGASTHHVVNAASAARSVINPPARTAATAIQANAPVRRSWSATTSHDDQQQAAEEARRLQLLRLEEQRLRDEREKKDAQMLMWRNRMLKALVIIVVGTIGLSVFRRQTGVTPFEYVQQTAAKAGEEPKGEKETQQ